jgi:hypothetical protein
MISAHETEKLSLQQIEQFLLAAKEVLVRGQPTGRDLRLGGAVVMPTDPGGRPGYLRVDTVHQGDAEHARGDAVRITIQFGV